MKQPIRDADLSLVERILAPGDDDNVTLSELRAELGKRDAELTGGEA